MTQHRFPTGARPSPRHQLLAAEPYRVTQAPPPQVAYVPKQLDMWGNNQYGDCVSAEEAFAKATYSPEIFIDSATVEAWASKGGFLNGADLASVLDAMKAHGFQVGGQLYNDGDKQGVDYSNETVLQSAIAQGPVKIAIDASALPSGAGNQQGWSAFGGSPGQYPNTDHCVSLAGYGPVAWLAQQLGVSVPAGAPANGYLLFTWSTIGIVDHAWLMSTCTEAWVRSPTTVGVPPLPGPAPTPPPGPNPPPTPPDHPVLDITLTGDMPGIFGGHRVTFTGKAVPESQRCTMPRSLAGWLRVIGDIARIEVDAQAGDLQAVLADLARLKADWGS